MSNGTAHIGNQFDLLIDGSALVHCETFSFSNGKGEIDITSRDSGGNEEYISDGTINREISFTMGSVRRGTNASGKEAFELLDEFYKNDASLGFLIDSDAPGNYTITGAGVLLQLDIDFGTIKDKVMASGRFKVNSATVGTKS